jgi:hypothetical protein
LSINDEEGKPYRTPTRYASPVDSGMIKTLPMYEEEICFCVQTMIARPLRSSPRA